MTAYVFKRKGARLYSARFRLKHERTLTQVELGCSNRQVAEKRLRELVEEREREAAGIVAPKAQREAAQTLLSPPPCGNDRQQGKGEGRPLPLEP